MSALSHTTEAPVSAAGTRFEDFEAAERALGADEVLVREWAAGHATGEHTHPFAVRARVVRGSLVLRCGDQERPLAAGDSFTLEAGVPHAETYGAEGATFWVARKMGQGLAR
jgi:quercetin dioxygenase-like cupin family protein